MHLARYQQNFTNSAAVANFKDKKTKQSNKEITSLDKQYSCDNVT